MAAALALVAHGHAPDPALRDLVDGQQIWRGQPSHGGDGGSKGAQPTGFAVLDDVLPTQGWPHAALTELLLPADGIGELQLLWPTLRRLIGEQSAAHAQPRPVVLVAPPYIPYAPAWHAGGIDLAHLHVVHADTDSDALWAAEQCLRSGACSAVLCWPHKADDRSLRRLQVAAQSGDTLGFVFRDRRESRNPSPAALRLQLLPSDQPLRLPQVQVLKCRGGVPPAQPIALGVPVAGQCTWT